MDNDILDTLGQEELEGILDNVKDSKPDRERAERIMARFDEKTGLETSGAGKTSRCSFSVKWAAAAAAALALILGAGGLFLAREAKAYGEAEAFFTENGLSTEGLSRAEIKAVYRDITTETFTYSKTAYVISHSMKTNSVPGYELFENTETLSKDMMRDILDVMIARKNASGVRYEWGIVYTHHDSSGGEGEWEEETGSFVGKYDGSELIWKKEFSGRYIEKMLVCGDGVLVVDVQFDRTFSSAASRAVRIDGNGNVLWDVSFGEKDERVCALLSEEDGQFTVFSRISGARLSFTRLDSEGKVVKRRITEGFTKGVVKAAHYKDGYLLQLLDYVNSEYASFAKVDGEGVITEIVNLTSALEEYHIVDMIEFEGRIYLSVYAAASEDSGNVFGYPEGLGSITRYCINSFSEKHDLDIPELTGMMKDHYTAMLLILEPEGGTVNEFYSVKGGFGGALGIDENGDLTWDFDGISVAAFSPATNAFSFYGYTRSVRYRFDGLGEIKDRSDTGEYKQFTR